MRKRFSTCYVWMVRSWLFKQICPIYNMDFYNEFIEMSPDSCGGDGCAIDEPESQSENVSTTDYFF